MGVLRPITSVDCWICTLKVLAKVSPYKRQQTKDIASRCGGVVMRKSEKAISLVRQDVNDWDDKAQLTNK